jgi:hypothetical protein
MLFVCYPLRTGLQRVAPCRPVAAVDAAPGGGPRCPLEESMHPPLARVQDALLLLREPSWEAAVQCTGALLVLPEADHCSEGPALGAVAAEEAVLLLQRARGGRERASSPSRCREPDTT